MRVLLATTQFAPEVGGVPRLLWDFCVHRPADMAVAVLSIRQQPAHFYADFDRRAGLLIRRVTPLPGKGVTSLSFGLQLAALVRSWKPDVILCGVAYPSALIVSTLQRLAGRAAWPFSFVVYAHSEDLTLAPGWQRLRLGRALRRAARIAVPSHFTRQVLQQLGVDEARLVVISPGVDPKNYLSQPSVQRRPAALNALPPDRWTLLTISRLVQRKGQDTVIRLLPGLVEAIPNLHYLVVGSGPDEAYLRELARTFNVTERVTFAGQVADGDLSACYQACDAFIMPTRAQNSTSGQSEVEGFGIVYLEAAAAGKPVIGGQTGGAVEAVAHGVTGLLVDPLDAPALADAILQLARNPTYARALGEAGRARVNADFTAQAFATRLADVLYQAANQDGELGSVGSLRTAASPDPLQQNPGKEK